MSDEIFKKVRRVISDQLGVEGSEISTTSHLQEDLDADTLSKGDLIDAIEKEFNVEFEPEQTSNVNTVEDLVNIVSDQLGDI
ncbi:MAG: acyl carrier protein [Candidatus Woykebacteria bacterium]